VAVKGTALLCACNVAIYAGIGGLVGLMPVYLLRFGAGAAEAGLFLAVAYACLAASNVGGGWLCRRVGRPKALLVGGGLVAAPLALAVGRAASFGAAMAAMAGLWLAVGVAMTTASILTGLGAESGRRGRRFGTLSLSAGAGLLLGSLVSGPVVDRWGFPALFALFAAVYLVVPVAGLAVDDRRGPREPAARRARPARGALPDRALLVLAAASTLAQAANILLFLSRALLMHGRGYDATAISTAAAVGSLLTLPLPALLGWLADRFSRKPLVLACFAAPALGLLVQGSAEAPWQFWLASALSTVVGASLVVASAVVADTTRPEAFGGMLGLLNATPWVGIVLGLTVGGAAIGAFGMETALRLGTLPSLLAMALLLTTPLSGAGDRSGGSEAVS
jgi:MFS family permease